MMENKSDNVLNGEKTNEKPKDGKGACAETLGRDSWEELRLIKSMAPRAACIIPASSHDFVSSSLLAVGAYALLIDDVEDIDTVLMNSIGVVVDVSAPKDLLHSFMEKFVPETQPVVVVASGAAGNERKVKLGVELLKCSPAAICGRCPDVVALAEAIVETPNIGENSVDREGSRKVRAKSVPTLLKTHRLGTTRSPSPARKMRDQKKEIARKATPIPAMLTKGRYRDCTFHEMDIGTIIKHGQQLAMHADCTVMFQDLNVLTDNEHVVDINTCQVGMQNIHSTVECMAALTAIVMGIVDDRGEECTILKCAHAACLYYTAGEVAVERATVKDSALPGSLRTYFIDSLHALEEEQIRKQAKIHLNTHIYNAQ